MLIVNESTMLLHRKLLRSSVQDSISPEDGAGQEYIQHDAA